MENKKLAVICLYDETTSDHFGTIHAWDFEWLNVPEELSEEEITETMKEIEEAIEPHVGFRGSRPYADTESFPDWILLISENAAHHYLLSQTTNQHKTTMTTEKSTEPTTQKKEKHTPGPWSIHPYQTGEVLTMTDEDGRPVYDFSSITIGAGETRIAEVKYQSEQLGYPCVSDLEEFRANAVLMIAAPDMLRGLRETLKLADWLPLKLRAKLEAIVSKATTIPDAVIHPKEDPAED